MSQANYTQACDFIRAAAGYNANGTILSRADASKIRTAIAKAIGMDDAQLAEKLAQAEQNKTDADRTKEANDALAFTSANITFNKEF